MRQVKLCIDCISRFQKYCDSRSKFQVIYEIFYVTWQNRRNQCDFIGQERSSRQKDPVARRALDIGKTATGSAVLKLIVQQVHHTITVIPELDIPAEKPRNAETVTYLEPG